MLLSHVCGDGLLCVHNSPKVRLHEPATLYNGSTKQTSVLLLLDCFYLNLEFSIEF